MSKSSEPTTRPSLQRRKVCKERKPRADAACITKERPLAIRTRLMYESLAGNFYGPWSCFLQRISLLIVKKVRHTSMALHLLLL